jgi:hypothetical protein
MLGLSTDINDLKYEKQINLNQTKHIVFKQYYMDVPVYTGEYFVHLDESNRITTVNGNYYSDIDLDINPKITLEQAISAAIDQVGFTRPVNSEPRADLEVFKDGEDFILTWKVKLNYRPNAIYDVFIDAMNNKLIYYQNRLLGMPPFTALANVYMTDPTGGLSEDEQLNNIDFSGYLEGYYVKVTGYGGSRAYSSSYDFRYEPEDTRFDEANVYWLVTNIAKNYYNQILGYYFGQVEVKLLTNVVGGAYDEGTNTMEFGVGDTTSATQYPHWRKPSWKDDDVYHEYTHAVTSHLGLAWGTEESLAKAEGYSDYFTASFTNDAELFEWYVVEYDHATIADNDPEFFNYNNWDNVTYNFIDPDPYGRGMIWSGACWDLREVLGPTIADKIIFKGIEYVPGNSDYETGRDGIIQGDNFFYNGQHEQTIINIFQTRGIGSPSTPSGFALTGSVGNHPVLSWNLNGEPDIYSYRIYQSINGGSYNLYTSVNSSTNSFTDYGVTIGNGKFDPAVCYKVTAYDIYEQESAYTSAKCTKADHFSKKTACNDCTDIPTEFSIDKNFPNPFNNKTNIYFALPEGAYITIDIYNLLGKKVLSINPDFYNAGYHSIKINASNLASGIYLYHFKAEGSNKHYQSSDKFILIK